MGMHLKLNTTTHYQNGKEKQMLMPSADEELNNCNLFLYDLEIIHFSIYPREIETSVHTKDFHKYTQEFYLKLSQVENYPNVLQLLNGFTSWVTYLQWDIIQEKKTTDTLNNVDES